MKNFMAIVAVIAAASVLAPTPGFCANVVGAVQNESGAPVGGAVISVRNARGQILSEGMTSPQGRYEIYGLAPGKYVFAIDPRQSALRTGTAVSYLSEKNLTINWRLSPADPALASAEEGDGEIADDPFGFSAAEFASLIVLGVGGVAAGVVGGYGAAGGFSSSSPASPAL